MKYSLSYCDITKISENIFEVVSKEGIVIDKNCAEEAWHFWDGLRKEPFGLLVNTQNSFSHSFEGARDIGLHPLQKKTALLSCNDKQETEFKTALQIKQVTGHNASHKTFRNRNEAIEWLNDLNS
ncbi:MAG: hypothetical protein KKB30_10570 [Proteobacteria bacterium]|nr:hypothetical protein [Pseudomonadota bacterium]MBU1717080.1 hypothetical protein [Pseudomonadota bacterium]